MSFQNIFEKFGITITEEEMKSEWGKKAKEIIKDIIKNHDLDADADDLAEQKQEVYLKHAQSLLKPLPGSVEIIKALHGLVPIALVTGSRRRNVELALDKCGIRKYMDSIVSANDTENGKPFPDPFLKAAKEIGIEPSKCVVLEDGTKGIVAAKTAGMKVVGLTSGHQSRKELEEAKPDMILESMKEVIELMKKTKLCFIVGNPVEHSLSPLMQNAAFEALGLDYHYQALRVERLGNITHKLREMAVGFNVTIPHKLKIIDYLDEIEPLAERIGAVNTVVNKDGRLIGYNTDSEGFGQVLKDRKMDVNGMNIVILGAGGAARAIAFWLNKEGAEITIVNRTKEKGEKLAKEVGCSSGEIKKADMFVNTTSVGMHPKTDSSPLDPKFIDSETIVYDIVYNPIQTKLIKEAKERGARTIDGVSMLVNQGVLSFKLWTGKEAPKEEMEKIVRNALGN